MAYNEKLVNRVKEALAHLPKVKETKMAKGALFMVDEKVCVTVADDELTLRIDPLLHEKLLKTKKCRTMKMKDKEYKGYVVVAEGDIKNKKEFDYWINLALEFNKKVKATPKKKTAVKKVAAKKGK